MVNDQPQNMLQLDGIGDDGDIDFDFTSKTERLRFPDSTGSSDGYSSMSMSGERAPSVPKHSCELIAPIRNWEPPTYCDRTSALNANLTRMARKREGIRPSPSATMGEVAMFQTNDALARPKTMVNTSEADECDVSNPYHWPPSYVSRKSVAILRESGRFEPNFQDRMENFQQKARRKKEELRQRAAAAEQSSVHPTPQINQVLRFDFSSFYRLLAKLTRIAFVELQETTTEFVAFVCLAKPQRDQANAVASR